MRPRHACRTAGPDRARRRLIATALGALPALAGGPARADLVSVVATVRRSVLAVGTFNALDSPRFTFRGTGFVVGDGTLVVTNHHVLPTGELPQAARLVVALPGGPAGASTVPEVRDARVLAADPEHDLAVLAIGGSPMPALPFAADGLAREGQAVALTGFPLGTALGVVPVTHRGIIAAVAAVALPPPTSRQLDARTLARLREGPFDIYQLDATAYPGNSGSPVYDAETGQVLGILNMVFVKGTKESALSAPTGISYAIPARHIRQLIAKP